MTFGTAIILYLFVGGLLTSMFLGLMVGVNGDDSFAPLELFLSWLIVSVLWIFILPFFLTVGIGIWFMNRG